jgi:hypothetical protein
VPIELAAGTENSVTDGAAYVLEEGDEPNAAIFSRAGLGFEGGGTLTVAGSYNDGIASKDELVIAGGTIRVTAVDDGVRGKDSILIEGGDLTVEAGGDGLKSDHDQDAALGCISVMDGVLRITAGGDGFDAETEVRIAGGELAVTTGGGSKVRLYSDVSAKGIKGTARVSILGGTLVINSADDALHSNGAIVVSGGQLDIDTGDDGLHADATLEIHGGDIRIHSSYEGLESAVVTITGGNVHLAASDDGINIVGGNDGSGALPGGGGGRGRDNFAQSGNNRLYVRGGYVYIDAQGDGVDANGSIEMTDGVLLINGPTQSMNGALDFGTFNISGGTLVAVGSAGMAMAPSGTSTQPAVLINLNGWIRGGTLIHFQDRAGQDVLTFASAKDYQSIVVSSSRLTVGSTYSVFYQGSSTGAVTDGLYEGGEYSGGTELGSYTQSSVVTNLGGRARQGP